MLRASTLFLLAVALWAQPAKNPAVAEPPKEVDRALRARVSEFLNDHVKGEFRKAEALVADDSKDEFYTRPKPRYLSCSGIANIRWSEHFTKAYVTALCTIPVMIGAMASGEDPNDTSAASVPTGPPTLPIPAFWKLEKGQWYWYLDKEIDRRTPFGLLPPAPVGKPNAPGTILPDVPLPKGMTLPEEPKPAPVDPGMRALIQAVHVPATAASVGAVGPEALHHVKLEPGEVTLKAGGKLQVKISNDAADQRQLMVVGTLAGIEAKLEAANVEANSSTTLNLVAGEGAKSGTLNVVVMTTGEMLPLTVTVK